MQQQPLAPIRSGRASCRALLVDEAGTAHIVFAQDGGIDAADTLSFCNLQRGLKTCASSGQGPNATAPEASAGGLFAGNAPGLNDDNDGPVPLAIGNQLFIVDRRFPDFFNTPSGTPRGHQRVPLELRGRRRDDHRARPDRR